ncbi:Histone demethylase UTY [Plecturocebus cupreus]
MDLVGSRWFSLFPNHIPLLFLLCGHQAPVSDEKVQAILLPQPLDSWDYRHEPPCPASFVLLVETKFLHIGRAGLELPTSGDPPAPASQTAGIIGVSHRARPCPLKLIDVFWRDYLKLLEKGFRHIGQAGLKLLTSGVHHHAQLTFYIFRKGRILPCCTGLSQTQELKPIHLPQPPKVLDLQILSHQLWHNLSGDKPSALFLETVGHLEPRRQIRRGGACPMMLRETIFGQKYKEAVQRAGPVNGGAPWGREYASACKPLETEHTPRWSAGQLAGDED